MYQINIWAVIVASVVAFVLCTIWYSPFLFGKTWMKLTHTDEESIAEDKARGIWKKYVIHFIATLISFIILSFMISITGPMRAIDGAVLGLILWIGFVASMSMFDVLWRKTSFTLALIDSGNILVGLIVGGAIIAAW